jgi:hypothetical protein
LGASNFRRILVARILRGATALCAACVLIGPASGVTLYWDTNGNSTGAGVTPTGTWSTSGGTNKNWSTSSSGGSTVNWTSASDAVFSAGTDATNAYAVTLAAVQNVSSITVEEGSPTLNSFAVNFNDATPDVLVASTSTLTFSLAPTSSTNGLNLGSATATGTTVFSANTAFSGTVNLAGGTLKLASTSYTFGTLNVTGSSTIDFAGATTLNLTNLTISAGVTLTIQNWTQASNFFYAANWTGATHDVMGSGPMDQIVFSPFPDGSRSGWDSYDNQIRPNVPEPRTYGALLLGALTGIFAWRRLVRRPAGHAGIPPDF